MKQYTICLLGVLFILTAANSLYAGQEAGHGDDGVFPLQALALANPALLPREILLKAFAESEGRQVAPSTLAPTVNQEYYYNYRAFSMTSESPKIPSHWAIKRISENQGPLLPAGLEEIYTGVSLSQANTKFTLVSTGTRLGPIPTVYSPSIVDTAELRQYSPDVFVGVFFVVSAWVYPEATLHNHHPSPHKANVCSFNINFDDLYTDELPDTVNIGDICGVFYLWKN